MCPDNENKTGGSAGGVLPGGACFACRLMSFLLRRTHDLLLLCIVAVFAAAGLARFKDINKYPPLKNTAASVQRVESLALTELRSAVPTNFQGRDISRWLFLGALYLASIAFGSAGSYLRVRADRLRLQRRISGPEPARPRSAEPAKPKSAEPAAKPAPVFPKPAPGGKLKRKDLLEIYAEAKKSLDAHKTNLAFLSIDVVDSTGMKAGEDPGIAERDFRRYKQMVSGLLESNRALKSTWTPDGVMICFGTVADAVRAGQGIITGLKKFNREVKLMKRDFAIRAGINSGDVFCDDDTPMEEMTDRTIDIAGHMQKHGCVNGIAISKHAIEPLLKEFRFADAGRVVDGCPVYEWKPPA